MKKQTALLIFLVFSTTQVFAVDPALEAQAKQAAAELKAVENEIARRCVKAVLKANSINADAESIGIVEKIYRNEGEWVQPGDPIMRVVQMDELKIEGFINAKLYPPSVILNATVTVELNKTFGAPETFSQQREPCTG